MRNAIWSICIFWPDLAGRVAHRVKPDPKKYKMKNNNLIATEAAGFQATLTNELGETIKKSVLFYIDGRDHLGMVSSFEREMIAENAWFHVIEKREKYKPSENAKFSTWAKKVAENFASDELDKLQNDPLHMTGLLHEDQPKNEDDAKKYSDTVSYRKSFGSVGDCSDQLYWHEMLETLKGIVSTYVGRDRTVAEMLIGELVLVLINAVLPDVVAVNVPPLIVPILPFD